MEMQQVRYFLAVSRTLNFTRAAEECNVTQPALTRAIKQLEDELGGELIRREGRNTHLTDLGNARRMIAAHGADLRYCPAWRDWFVWDEARWARDVSLEVVRRAKATVPSAARAPMAAANPRMNEGRLMFFIV